MNGHLQPASGVTLVPIPVADLSEGALERARLRAEYFADHAAASKEVREFRRRIVAQGRLPRRAGASSEGSVTAEGPSESAEYATVSPEIARAFLASPAAAMLEVEDFEGMGRAVFDSFEDINVIDVLNDGKIVSFTVRVDIQGRDPIERTFTVPVTPGFRRSTLWDGTEALVRPGSVLDELRWLSEWLSREFPWDYQDAAWFVLTGDHPMRPLIETSLHVRKSMGPPYTDARITLSVDATLSPDEVASHYARVRDQLLGGVRIRRAEERTLEVFRFVNARRLQKPTSTWGQLVREWDESCPEAWRFDGNEKAFRLYWRRGFRSVFPEFRSTPTRSPPTKEQA